MIRFYIIKCHNLSLLDIGEFVAEVKFLDCSWPTQELNGPKKNISVQMIGKELVKIRHHWVYHFPICLI